MVILFSFSITPKHFLHDLLADHTDTVCDTSHGIGHHIEKAGFKCDTHSFVSTSDWDFSIPIFDLSKPVPKSAPFCLTTVFYLPSTASFIELRGPPALG